MIRGAFRPIQTAPSPILAAVDPESLPDLAGYDFAEAKPDAQVILTSDREDPVLAKWQYGLGRVIAWTADNGSDLAAPWAMWEVRRFLGRRGALDAPRPGAASPDRLHAP